MDAGYYSAKMLNYAHHAFRKFLIRLPNNSVAFALVGEIKQWKKTGLLARNGEEMEYGINPYRDENWATNYTVVTLRYKVYRKESPKKNIEAQMDPLFPVEEETWEWHYFHLVTNLNWKGKKIVKAYRQRANCENWISELKSQFYAGDMVRQKVFRETKICFMLAVFAYNFSLHFRRKILKYGMQQIEQKTYRDIFAVKCCKILFRSRQYFYRIQKNVVEWTHWKKFMHKQCFIH